MPKSASKPKNWEYVSDTEEGHNQWIVSSTDKRAEVRNLFVQDRILDQTERVLNFSSKLIYKFLSLVLGQQFWCNSKDDSCPT